MSSSIKFLKRLTKRGTKSSDQLRLPGPSPSSITVESEVGQAGSFKDESPTSSVIATVREVISPAVNTTIQEPDVLPDVPAPAPSVPPEPDRPKTRLEQAHTELLAASASLSSTLCDYFAGTSDSNASASDFALPTPVTPETFGASVERVLLKQQNQPPTIASRVGTAISKICPLASLTLGLAASATESAALTPVKGTINSLALLLTLADQEAARGEDFLKQLERIQYQSLRVAEVQKCAEVEIGELLREKSTNLMTSVIRFFNSSIIFFKHDYFYNLGKTVLLGPKIYSDARAELDLAIAEYDQALLLQVTIKVLAMRPIPPVDQTFQKSTLATWLKSSFWPVDAQFSNNCELRAPGTLQWVLEASEFKTWRLGESKSLWLNGLPGVGKSIIIAYLIQLLKAQHPDSVVLYFFCKAGDSTLDNVDRVIRTLAMQIALASPEAREKLQMLMEEGFQCENDAYAFSRLIKDTLTVVSGQVFVVIDGLDECFGGAAEAISTLLDGLQKLPVKLLVSSRPTPEISQAMGWGPKRTLTFEDSRDDIKLYITMRVTKSKALQKGFSRLQKDPTDFLSEKSQGNFLWVSIVLNLLERTPGAKAFQKAIETLPKGIVGVYEKVVDKLIAAESWEMAEAILVSVLFSARPMTMSELTVAVSLLVDEVLDLEQFVESNCGSFLGVVPGKDGPSVHIVHETFRAYITDPAVSKERCVPPGKSHMRLAAACLGCLIEDEDDDLADLRRYSTRHWFRHFGDVWEIERDTVVLRNILGKIHAFMNDDEAVRRWMREFTFLMEREHGFWDIGCFMSDVHYGIYDWLKSGVIQMISENSDDNDDADEDLQGALAWRMKVISSDSFLAHSIVTNIAFVWLNTNWKEVLMSRMAFTQALATAHILQLVEPFTYTPGTPLYNNPYAPKVPDHAKTKPGWTWRYATSFSNHWDNLTLEHIDSLASLGGYNPAIGLQSGNYAFAVILLRSDACIKPFQRAIDEHPEAWHFHEALGNWYTFSAKEKAVECYGEAMKCDPKIPAGCAIDYWGLLSEIKKRDGDVSGAVEALRTGVELVPEKNAEAYWDRIANIYQDGKDWEKLGRVLREAIERNPTAARRWWTKLADNYDRTFDWRGKMETYFEAMKRDPENLNDYAQDLRLFAGNFKDYQLLEPALEILRNGIERHKEHADLYRKEIAECYLGARKWKEAAELYEEIRAGPNAHDWEFKWLNHNLGNAYLGMGETTRALAAYQEKRMEKLAAGDVSGNSDDAAYVHMILGEFTIAIQQTKADITANIKYYPNGPDNWYKASEFMHAYQNLGVCYEALGRMEDAQASFKSAVQVFEKFITELEPFVHTDNKTSYYRSDARVLLEFGLMLEKIGRREDARRIYEGAGHMYERTTFVGDDEPLQWENEQVALAVRRVSEPELGMEMPSLLEEIGGPRLELRLCLGNRTNWYSYENWTAPRFRGGKDGYPAAMLKDVVS